MLREILFSPIPITCGARAVGSMEEVSQDSAKHVEIVAQVVPGQLPAVRAAFSVVL